MTFEIFLNLLIIALLTVGIIYAIVLEYRLSSVKENHRKLSSLIKQFYEASAQAQKELIRLKTLEEKSRQDLKSDMEKAALIRDELKYLLTKAEQTKTIETYGLDQPDSLFSFQPVSTLSQSEEEVLAKLKHLK